MAELTGVLCDRRMPIAVKGKVYRTMIRPVLIYGSEAWSLRRREEERLERTEMRMLRWILGLTLKDRKRNDDIRCIIGVACIMDKVCEARLRWYGHIQRREEDDCVKRILEFMDNEVEEDRERDGPTSSSTTWRSCGSRWRTQGIVPNGEGEPMWLTLTRGIHSLKERERERS